MRLPTSSAARGIVVLALGLLIAAFLDAAGLRKQAEIQPQGFQRRVALAVTGPLVDASRAVGLTAPRHALQVAIGRQNEDVIDTRVELPPPAGPLPRPLAHPRPPAAHRRPRPKPKPVFTAARPLRIWVAGDSLAEVPGQALERVSDPALDVLAIESQLSTGLTRPDLYNWFVRIPQAVAQYRPRVVVLSFGADDAHNYIAGVPAGKTIGPLGSPTWDAEYFRRADGVTRELNARGIYVVWLGLPIPDGPGFGKTFPVVNRILRRVVRAHPTMTTFVDTWRLLEGAHGQYTAYLRVNGKLTLMRLPDGVHYTDAAGDLIAQQLLTQLRRVFTIR